MMKEFLVLKGKINILHSLKTNKLKLFKKSNKNLYSKSLYLHPHYTILILLAIIFKQAYS